MHRISAIIVTYNPDLDDFRKQLGSIVSQNIAVIIVDNLSENYELISEASKEIGEGRLQWYVMQKMLVSLGLRILV